MARYDTAQFQRNVIRDAKIPAGSSYRTAATLLDLASDEMETLVVPELLKVTGGHLMAYEDVALVAGKTRYRFPERAIRPERLQIVDSAGLLLGKLHVADGDLVDEVLAGRCPRGDALGYWTYENNHAVVVFNSSVTSSTGRQLRTYYRRQPNRLIDTTSCWKITNINGQTLDLGPINTGEAAHNVTSGDAYDIITTMPGFEAVYESLEATQTQSNVLEGAVDPEVAEVGQYVAPAGYTPVPQLPVALHGVLVAYTVARILRESGHGDAAEAALAEGNRKLTAALSTITPRSSESETTDNDAWGV
jgi:hypothetical protein